ncbi:MAG TPA: DNA-3-methyladenine glycosylase [Steroidobacteraceae bacterium]|nr:DNA-3-methyladenine glycosylase [Steroidobacteraceae bacterium]
MTEPIIAHLTRVDVNMGALIKAYGPYGLIAELDRQPFESLARAIAHQQLHANAARSILQRFVGTCGSGAFPSPQDVMAASTDTLRAAGLSFSKIAALKDLAAKTIDGTVPDSQTLVTLSDLEIIERLTQVRGIGRWTVEMMLMFQLGRPDILPVDDFGIRNGFRHVYGLRKMPAPKVLAAFGERWAPHRTAAAWYLWRALELKKAGKLPHPLERVVLPRLRRRVRRRKVARKKKTAVRTGRRPRARK